MTNYNPVTPEVISKLNNIIGGEHVLHGSFDILKSYSHDEVREKGYTRMPEVVVKPVSAGEISRILTLAGEMLIPVTPRGAGSGLSGSAVPVCGGIVLSLERMNRILEIDRENMATVVEPGVITNELNQKLLEKDLFYAGYPLSRKSCFIGGNVALNAGGAKAVKYGVTGRYVLGLEVVLPTGEILNLGGKRRKDATGYNLLNLMIGSEGTLGIFTQITLGLLPRPPETTVLLAPFSDLQTAVKSGLKMIPTTGTIPSTLELLDSKCIKLSCRLVNEKVPCLNNAGAFLLIEADGGAKEVEHDYNGLADYLLNSGALDVFVAHTPTDKARLWKIREGISEALSLYYQDKATEDIAAPPAMMPEIIAAANSLAEEYGLECASFGHLGDGNVHLYFLPANEKDSVNLSQSVNRIRSRLYQTAQQSGATLSGEHGVGCKRKEFIDIFLSKKELELMRQIKQVFDPHNILNPGKIFGAS